MDRTTPDKDGIPPKAVATPAQALVGKSVWSLPGLSLQSLLDDARFRLVPETMVDGLIVIDAGGIVRYVNPGCETLFLWSADNLLGRNVSVLMPPDIAQAHDGYLARHRATRVNRIIGVGRELQGLKADGTVFPMYLSVGEALLGTETVFVGIIYDLTEKKRAEEVILHHQKLEAIGQLSGGIAHDFNNILSVIGGNLEMILQADLSPAARRAVLRAQDAAVRAARITQRLLAFARKQPLRRQSVDINKALGGLSDLLRRTIGEKVDIRMHLSAEPVLVEADIDQFETGILNLAINARDAMPEGGRLTIETEAVRFEDDPRTAQEAPPGKYFRVSVSDSGAGMPASVLARAMEPFFTTKEVGAGTGLGLSMVYGFMKQLGGLARIYSEEGRGTRVCLYFPRGDAADVVEPELADGPAPTGHGETLLVVEDDPDVRLVTVSRLESLGYRVKVAADAVSALEILHDGQDIRLALIDVVMRGGMDGHALADQIERLRPDIRLILTSGYSPRMAGGAPRRRPFLPKPASRIQLARMIDNVLKA